MIHKADFSEDGRFRFSLYQQVVDKLAGDLPLLALWLGCNPSTANAEKHDPTSRQIEHFTKLWGYEAYIVVNPIPLVSSTPAEAIRWAAGYGWKDETDEIVTRNLAAIRQMVMLSHIRIACFGNLIGHSKILTDTLKAVGTPLHCIGKTESGAPKHPLARGKHRVPADQHPILWKDAA